MEAKWIQLDRGIRVCPESNLLHIDMWEVEKDVGKEGTWHDAFTLAMVVGARAKIELGIQGQLRVCIMGARL